MGRLTRLAVVACGVLAWAGAPPAIAGPQEPASQTGAAEDQPYVPHLRHADSTAAQRWAPARRDGASFLAQSGRLRGLTGLRRGLVLDLNPVVTSRVDGADEPASTCAGA